MKTTNPPAWLDEHPFAFANSRPMNPENKIYPPWSGYEALGRKPGAFSNKGRDAKAEDPKSKRGR
jgi:hypothetical protein